MKTSDRDTGPKSGLAYVTDGVVGASELRVLAGAVVVTMSGDQDYEKEGYCREGSHRVAVGKAVRKPALATCNSEHLTTDKLKWAFSDHVHPRGGKMIMCIQ
jgi:hypothetical protein